MAFDNINHNQTVLHLSRVLSHYVKYASMLTPKPVDIAGSGKSVYSMNIDNYGHEISEVNQRCDLN